MQPKNIVGMVEADIIFSGVAGAGCTGLWFKGNSNQLPDGVSSMEATSGGISYLAPNLYGDISNKIIYKIDEKKEFSDSDYFFVNPYAIPYNGPFTPCSGGVKSRLFVKAFAKAGVNEIWKRTA